MSWKFVCILLFLLAAGASLAEPPHLRYSGRRFPT